MQVRKVAFRHKARFSMLSQGLSTNPNAQLGMVEAHAVDHSTVAMHFSSMAIGVGNRLISIVVRQGWLSLKYSA